MKFTLFKPNHLAGSLNRLTNGLTHKGIAMEIIIRAKDIYGERKFYPVCETAKLFAAIAGTKTLTVPVLGSIKAMGYKLTFEVTDWEVV
jgi:hypothetical protein